MAAHTCYVLAGLPPQPFDVNAQLCLLGGDHSSNPRCYASTAAMQLTQVLEWARCQGGLSLQYATLHDDCALMEDFIEECRELPVGLHLAARICFTVLLVMCPVLP